MKLVAPVGWKNSSHSMCAGPGSASPSFFLLPLPAVDFHLPLVMVGSVHWVMVVVVVVVVVTVVTVIVVVVVLVTVVVVVVVAVTQSMSAVVLHVACTPCLHVAAAVHLLHGTMPSLLHVAPAAHAVRSQCV